MKITKEEREIDAVRDSVQEYFNSLYRPEIKNSENLDKFFETFLQQALDKKLFEELDMDISGENFTSQISKINYQFCQCFFDNAFYLGSNQDVEQAGLDPFDHYMESGWREGRDPSTEFSTTFYLDTYQDVKELGINPFLHWALHGRVEQRMTRPEASQDRNWKDNKSNTLLLSAPVQTYCFYLPQFHKIPENNSWWGQGFTEWTNTKKTSPLFAGHYHPKVPGDIGYYDLSDIATIRRQAEIAKSYGITGFSIYYYWFNGKRLLEKPLDILYENKDIDIKFNICWANENWTRSWDGLEKDILISQNHSIKNDKRIIEDIVHYMRDDRYTRVNGKPLITIYRPDQLPNPKRTVDIWRRICRSNGIGEIYLCATTSFSYQNPEELGFDAQIEFPPNNTSPDPAKIDECLWADNLPERPSIFSLESIANRSITYERESYTRHRGVCPRWDNTARKNERGTIFIDDDPKIFEKWTKNAISDTVKNFTSPSQRLIFINAWNEWAEGAYLEPDSKYGYSYLEAFKSALLESGAKEAELTEGKHNPSEFESFQKLAVVIHAFYIEELENAISQLGTTANSIRFIITCPIERESEARVIVKKLGLKAQIIALENRGRDIRPFFKAVKLAYAEGYKYILKIHLKKSTHRSDGHDWRDSLFRSLFGENMKKALEIFEERPSVGLIGSREHYLSLSVFLASNYEGLTSILKLLNVNLHDYLSCGFFAGTMFYINTEAAYRFVRKLEGAIVFEGEAGQVDGTTAHAIERSFVIFCASNGYNTYDIKTGDLLYETGPGSVQTGSADYRYAKAQDRALK